ncbi:MAG TPA: DUF1579 domain-containing protein [Caulobacter sp.]|nr:DUF1579 domain-containing protein [Caulobacter sp.]
MRRLLFAASAASLSLAVAAPALAQYDPAATRAAQTEAMKALSVMDGVWRGPAWTIDQTGTRHEVTQTERIGTFLGGSVRVLEGRGYNADGTVGFNALGVLSYDPARKAYTLSSWAQGRSGDFPLTATADGYVWTTPAGPNATIRYTAVIKDGAWREIGEYVVEGQPPRPVFEMNLVRLGDSDWPAGGAVPAK